MTIPNPAQSSQNTNNEPRQRGSQVFEAIGRFSVKFRWLIVLVWIVGTVLAVQNFPSLSSVTQSNNTSFLPSSAPSQKAINWLRPR